MFGTALFRKPSLLMTLFSNRPVDECPEFISNPISEE